MGSERRLFARTEVAVDGALHWATKRRIGNGIKSHEVPITTVDISVDGLKVKLAKAVGLPAGASCRVSFEGESSPARVLQAGDGDGDDVLRLHLEHPPREFMQVIDNWLDVTAGGRKFVETTWLGDGLTADYFADRPA